MIKKIKLVHLISSLKLGGAEAVLVDLLKQLGTTQYEHHVVYFHGGPNLARIQALGIPTYHITGAVSLYDPLFWVRLYRCIKGMRPALIHAHLWAANLAGRLIGRLLGIQVINTIHTQLLNQGRFRCAIDFVSLPLANAVVAVGPAIFSSGRRWPYDEKKIQCITNGVDVAAIQQRALEQQVFREQLGWSAEQVVIGTVGRLEDEKNYHALIEAFARVHAVMHETRLLIVGTGSLEQSLRAHAQKLHVADKVQFVVGKMAYGYYSMMDVFVLASHYEGLSIALLEAISCGLACITTGQGDDGKHELITSGVSGIVIPVPTAQAIQKALLQMLGASDTRKKMADAARAVVREQYSLATMATSYAKLYDILVGKEC